MTENKTIRRRSSEEQCFNDSKDYNYFLSLLQRRWHRGVCFNKSKWYKVSFSFYWGMEDHTHTHTHSHIHTHTHTHTHACTPHTPQTHTHTTDTDHTHTHTHTTDTHTHTEGVYSDIENYISQNNSWKVGRFGKYDGEMIRKIQIRTCKEEISGSGWGMCGDILTYSRL